MSTEIEKKRPMELADYSGEEGAGFENQSDSDLVLPFVSVLQALSKPVTNRAKGAEPGKLFNTVTEEFSDEVGFVPAHTERLYVEWRPRNQGGGFIARHAADSEVVKTAVASSEKFGRYKTPAGNDLVETFYVYGVTFHDDGRVEPAVIAFTSTKISVYKKWMTTLRMFVLQGDGGRKVRPPLFAHSARVTTVQQKNKEGEFYNFSVKPAQGDVKSSLMTPDDHRFAAARTVREMVTSGKARAAEQEQEPEASEVF